MTSATPVNTNRQLSATGLTRAASVISVSHAPSPSGSVTMYSSPSMQQNDALPAHARDKSPQLPSPELASNLVRQTPAEVHQPSQTPTQSQAQLKTGMQSNPNHGQTVVEHGHQAGLLSVPVTVNSQQPPQQQQLVMLAQPQYMLNDSPDLPNTAPFA